FRSMILSGNARIKYSGINQRNPAKTIWLTSCCFNTDISAVPSRYWVRSNTNAGMSNFFARVRTYALVLLLQMSLTLIEGWYLKKLTMFSALVPLPEANMAMWY